MQPDRDGLSRRIVLKRLTAGAVAASATHLIPALRAAGVSEPAPRRVKPGPVDRREVLELADLIRTTPRERVFDATFERIERGATHREVLAATLLAGVQDVRPWPPGVKFHTVLMAPSALQLGEAAGGDMVWLPVFFNIDVLKSSQAQDIDEGDWELPPPPAPLTDDPARAKRALTAALEEWDIETADRAVTAAVRILDRDELFEIFWPIGGRDFRNIGHTMIHTSQMHRALGLLVPEYIEPVMRSLVYGLLGGEAGDSTAAFERNRRRVGELPAGWENGDPDPEASGEVFRKLRTLSPRETEDLVVALLERGVAPRSIWDGLRVNASEILFRLARSDARNAQLLGVHPMTLVNAFHHASEISGNESTRRLMLLQAASWTAASRDLLVRVKDLDMKAPGFDGLDPPVEVVTLDQAVDAADVDYVASGSMVLRLARDRRDAIRFIDACRTLMLARSPEHHHHKYAAAVFEEFGRTDPRWSPYLLATCLSYLPGRGAKESDVTREIRPRLRRLQQPEQLTS